MRLVAVEAFGDGKALHRNKSMELHLKIIGLALIALSLVHVIFPRYFAWRRELSALSLINRQMMVVHTFFIALTVMLMGILCFFSANKLLHTRLGKQICLGLGIFWGIRALVQFFGYSAELWKGKAFETSVHVIFSLFWIYLTGVFWLAYSHSAH
jgi:hypothetical protein